MRTWTLLGPVAAAAAVTMSACSGSSTSDITQGSGDGGASADGAPAADGGAESDAASGPLKCDSVAKALCERFDACTRYIPVAFGDVATCIKHATANCTKALAAPGMSVTQGEIDACATAQAATTCDDLFSNRGPAACKKPGTLADGTRCGSNGQCSSGHCRKPTKGANCGACGKVAATNELCAEDADCTTGLVCNSDRKCAARAKDGEVCGVNDCAYGLKCFSGKCTKVLAEGAPCTRAADQSDACDLVGKLDYCGFGAGATCEPLTLATTKGAACGIVGGKFVLCAFEAKCTGGVIPGVCEAPREEGAACNDTDAKCREPYTCDQNKCILPDPAKCK